MDIARRSWTSLLCSAIHENWPRNSMMKQQSAMIRSSFRFRLVIYGSIVTACARPQICSSITIPSTKVAAKPVLIFLHRPLSGRRIPVDHAFFSVFSQDARSGIKKTAPSDPVDREGQPFIQFLQAVLLLPGNVEPFDRFQFPVRIKCDIYIVRVEIG